MICGMKMADGPLVMVSSIIGNRRGKTLRQVDPNRSGEKVTRGRRRQSFLNFPTRNS